MVPAEPATRILALLRAGPLRAGELAAILGVDASAVRRRLDALRAEGLVARHDAVEGRGRPKARYSLTPAGWERFPRDYALLLEALLAEIRASDGGESLEAKLAAIAKNLAATVPPAATPEATLAQLVRFYDRLGFEASLERGPDGPILVQRNCIVLRAARAEPHAVCACFDQAIIRAALPETSPRLVSCMANGDAVCRHALDPA